MSTVRTLPIRVAPIEGEALDSWLEALAHRTHTAFGDLLSAIGLNPVGGVGTSAWVVQLTTDEAAMISAATGTSRDTIETMTLQHYSGRAVRIQPDTRALSRAFPWGRGRGSRFCPACLEETGGRWQLAWRLGWTFACTTHNCLLADACPHCGAVPRLRSRVGDLIPQPGRCAHPATDATGRTPERCGADLTCSTIGSFDAQHPVLRAQRIVNTLIDTETETFGVYGATPQPRFNVLADIRAVAGRALAYATPQDLERITPADLLTAYQEANQHEHRRYGPAHTEAKPGLAAPAHAATAAVGVLAALHALASPDIDTGGDALRWLVASSRERGSAVSATNIGWGRDTSPVLTGVQLAALGPTLKPSDQLRHRIGSPLPAQPAANTAQATALARSVPAMLWPAWSLRLSIPNCHQRQLRPALSAAVLLVNNRLNLDEAARLAGSPLDGHAVSRVLQLLEKHDQWPSIRAAIIRIADHLARHKPPIDYERRRQLDYTKLLPDTAWAQICRDTATPGPRSIRARIARCFLFEQLSGRPTDDAPYALDDNGFRTKVADFPQHLTPELTQALDLHAQEFLADYGVNGEPSIWRPPAGALDGLDLPGNDPDAVNIAELHKLLTVDGKTLGAAATLTGTSLETARYLLAAYPAPRPS
jgi:hypothetical protein